MSASQCVRGALALVLPCRAAAGLGSVVAACYNGC